MASRARVVEANNIPDPEGSKTAKTPVASTVDAKSDRKTRVSQSDVPNYSLDDALRVAKAIRDNYAFKDASPLEVATALNMTLASSGFRMLCGSSIAYGLTEGDYNAGRISVQPIARRILEPTEEGDDLTARRQAILKPRILAEFLKKYNQAKLPREDIALNVLVQMGVPRDSTKTTYDLILKSATSVGFIHKIKDNTYINLQTTATVQAAEDGQVDEEEQNITDVTENLTTPPALSLVNTNTGLGAKVNPHAENRRVYITHGKNKAFIHSLKEVLGLVDLEPVVSVERETVSLPLPDKVINDMKQCGAAIIHVDDERKLIDPNNPDAGPTIILNQNVLIEIGAAMALYGRRFILLVKQGVTLPSNLSGLYEVRYQDDKLDGDTTIRLLKAIKDIKNHPLPKAIDVALDNNS